MHQCFHLGLLYCMLIKIHMHTLQERQGIQFEDGCLLGPGISPWDERDNLSRHNMCSFEEAGWEKNTGAVQYFLSLLLVKNTNSLLISPIYLTPDNRARTPGCALLSNFPTLIVIFNIPCFTSQAVPAEHMSVMNAARSQKSTASHRWIREMHQLGGRDINLINWEHDGIWYTTVCSDLILHLCGALEYSEVAVGSLPLWIQHHIVCTTQHPLWLPCTRDTPLIPVSLWLLHDDGNPPPPDSRVSASTPAGPGYKRKKKQKKPKTLYLAAIRSNVSFFSLENMTSLCYLWLRRYRFSLRCLSSAAPCGDLDEDKQNTYGFYTMVHHVVNRARKHVLTWIHRDGSGPCWLS